MPQHQKNYKNHQQGVAIISVLVIVAIIAIISTKITINNQRFIHSSANMLGYKQKLLYAISVEAWATNLLTDDIFDNQQDSLMDNWANDLNDSTVGNYTLSGEIIDRQAKININILADHKNIHKLSQVTNLFKKLDIDTSIIDAIIDYIDNDDIKYSDSSAENSYYTRLEQPYKIANNYITDISELMLVKGMNTAILAKLIPFIWAAPKNVQTINVNTATQEVLLSIHSELTVDNITKILDKRLKTAFNNIDEFIVEIDKDNRSKISKDLLTVSSSYFAIMSQVDGINNTMAMTSYVYRNKTNEPIIAISRRIIR